MQDWSVCIGGQAGEGINRAGELLARLFTRMGWWAYMYYDYPSLIRGGHNFALVRAADRPVGTHRTRADYLIALNQDTLTRHEHRIGPESVVIFDAGRVEADGIGIPVEEILAGENAPAVTANTCLLGAFCRAAGIPDEVRDEVISRHLPHPEVNLQVARRGSEASESGVPIPRKPALSLPVISGAQAIGLGLVRGGLDLYIAYPMTPSSGVLHYLADEAERLSVRVIHPENEIAVMLMALGAACAGRRTAVGTSGGGFSLMSEGLSFAGQAEIPAAIVLAQRPGPSTGIPTYTSQADLLFALSAGQGEFSRLVVAPANPAEAYRWSAIGLSLAWSCQVPAIILVDKTLTEGLYTADLSRAGEIHDHPVPSPGGGPYARYALTEDGISPLATVPTPDAVIKVNSYTHDEDGISTEDPEMAVRMAEKRVDKKRTLEERLSVYPQVQIDGDAGASRGVVCFGSTAGACGEAAERLGLRCVRPVVIAPFPTDEFSRAVAGLEQVIVVEQNATGQLGTLLAGSGMGADAAVLQDTGRPWAIDDLEERLRKVIAS